MSAVILSAGNGMCGVDQFSKTTERRAISAASAMGVKDSVWEGKLKIVLVTEEEIEVVVRKSVRRIRRVSDLPAGEM